MREYSKRWFLLIAIVLPHVAGCGGDNSDSDASHSQSVLASNANNIEVPFQGTIRAKQWLHSPVNSAEVTYTIRHDRIRREVVSTGAMARMPWSKYRAGVICHPAGDEVVLYSAERGKKRYCRMTLAEYRELCSRQTCSRSKTYYGFGCIFADVPPESERTTKAIKDAVKIDGLTCDRLVINFGDQIHVTIVEADYSEAIVVDRKLLTLVEIGLTDDVKGFPLRMRRVEGIRQLRPPEKQDDDRLKNLLKEAANTIADGLEKALESGLEVVKIDPKIPDDSAFAIPAEFSEVPNIEAFEAEFFVPHSGFDWDD